jgi:phospholipase C
VLDAIASDPETWSKSVLINFDENDGYFDSVPPPVLPGTAAATWTTSVGSRSASGRVRR